ncbi:MAG: hypothetical protein NVSMB4_18750 [Acidimicrobiales bacterium]
MGSLLTRPAPTLVVNERGGPVPPSGLVDRLHRIDPALGVRWMANFDASCWAVTWEWPLSDARWSRVQSSEIPREAAYDIIGYLPPGCTADEAAPFVESHLKAYPSEKIQALRSKVATWNEVEVPNQQVQTLIADTMDDVGREQRAPKGQLITAPTTGRVGRRK